MSHGKVNFVADLSKRSAKKDLKKTTKKLLTKKTQHGIFKRSLLKSATQKLLFEN